ncbi:hypothetical protein ABZX98_34615 [Streptomyces sp. NPDC002992]|uniref:hypothetical protein n=1 Tax=Streptomyces sp. NPDC002992 TaxID=3154273 RepID=UPI00339F87F8
MAEATFPHLGWNPAPGSPPEIAALKAKLTTSATSLGTAWRLVDELLSNSATWRGEAATAFREALADDLPRHLKNAHTSLTKAATRLGTWHDSLVGYQETARRYESQAALDAKTLSRAEATWRTAPEAELKAAEESLTRAREALEHVRRKARELEETHRVEAGKVAKSLNEATDRLAPKEPGWLDKTLTWVDDNLGDILSTLSAIAGLIAIFATGGLVIPLLFIAAGLSLAAMAVHASDPKIRSALKAGFTEGRLDGKFASAVVTLAGDAVGAVPGIGAVAKGARAASLATGFRSQAGAFARGSHGAMREINEAPKPIVTWVTDRRGHTAAKPTEAGIAAAGVTASGSGLIAPEDSDAARWGAAVTDTARISASDIPHAVKIAQTWARAASR